VVLCTICNDHITADGQQPYMGNSSIVESEVTLSFFLMAVAAAAHGQAAGRRDGAIYSDMLGCAGRGRRRQQLLDRRSPEATASPAPAVVTCQTRTRR
jgi:hypothetical protein